MGFLDNIFKFKATEPISQNSGSQAFSTPFMQIGKGNLSAPYINNNMMLSGGIIRFGADNLYPELLNQLYYQSPIHGACLDFISQAAIGGGYSWIDESVSVAQTVDQKTFEKVNKFIKLVKSLTLDYVIHHRVCVLVTKTSSGIKLKRLDPSTIRNNKDCETFAWSSDWSRGQSMKTYKRYSLDANDKESLYVYQDETPGQDVYPIPQYNSVLNWAFLDSEQSFFHKSNLQNSIFPAAVIRRPKEFSSVDEIDKFKQEIGSKTGAANAGRLLVLTGNGFDDVPEFQAISANNNSSLFTETAKELKENIAIGHKINPSIIGIKVAGSLGNSQELEMSYQIFEKNVVLPLRATVTEFLNDLVDICGIKNTVAIKEFRIVDKVIEETMSLSDVQIKK